MQTKFRNEMSEDATQPKEVLELHEAGCVLQSAHCIIRSCRHLETPWVNNMTEAVYAIGEEIQLFQIILNVCIVP